MGLKEDVKAAKQEVRRLEVKSASPAEVKAAKERYHELRSAYIANGPGGKSHAAAAAGGKGGGGGGTKRHREAETTEAAPAAASEEVANAAPKKAKKENKAKKEKREKKEKKAKKKAKKGASGSAKAEAARSPAGGSGGGEEKDGDATSIAPAASSADGIVLEGYGDAGSDTAAPAPITSFADPAFEALFGPELAAVLTDKEACGYTAPTRVQSRAWPVVMGGRDVVCVAQTGSGKTAAFLVPLLRRVRQRADAAGDKVTEVLDAVSGKRVPSPIGLVLAPTRELALQTQKNAMVLAKAIGLRSVCVFGGIPIHNSVNAVKGGANAFPHLLVATPGRLIDLARTGKLSLAQIRFLVVDEADRMLDLGFAPQLEQIVNSFADDAARAGAGAGADEGAEAGAGATDGARQTTFFSATWPAHVQRIAAKFLASTPTPIRIYDGQGRGGESSSSSSSSSSSASPSSDSFASSALVAHERISQEVRVVREFEKRAVLRQILLGLPEASHKTIVFLKTKKMCDVVVNEFRAAGRKCGALHGGRQQWMREAVVKDFMENKIRLLFATDVAARGLDAKDVTTVVNFDFPVQRGEGGIEEYVHRIGRTGRAGRTGSAVTLFTEEEDGETAGDLLALLARSKQAIPAALQALATAREERNREAAGRAAAGGEGEMNDAAKVAKRAAKKAKKKEAKAVRVGDWQCPKCHKNVFASKDKCFQCGTGKP
jgi:ATP-dependent RNA helicase DDX5/DBP2